MTFTRRVAIAVLSTLVAGTAYANSGGEKPKEEGSTGLELLNLPLPVARNGRLINYLYLSTELSPAPKRDIWKMRESTHFLRENIILAAHRVDFSDPGNPEKLDYKRATAMIAAEAAKVYGAGAFSKIAITSVDSKRTGIAKRYAPQAVAATPGA